jgi:hypothetical protein
MKPSPPARETFSAGTKPLDRLVDPLDRDDL